MTTEEILGMFAAGLIVGFLLEITEPDKARMMAQKPIKEVESYSK